MRLRTRLILGAIGISFVGGGLWLKTHAPFPGEPARKAIGEDDSSIVSCERKPCSYNGWLTTYTAGDGPLIVLLASAGREISDFNELATSLNKAGYKTLGVEADGISEHDEVDTKSFEDFARKVDRGVENRKRPIVFIGHAFGNRLARYTIQNTPEDSFKTSAAILLASGGQVPMEPKAEQALRDIFNPMKSHRSRMEDVDYAFFAKGNDIPDHWTRGWHTKTAIAQGKAVAASADDDSWHCAGGVPMLIVQPMQDRIAPIENAYALRDKCPQEVEIVEIQNAGHALLPEQPDAVAEAVLTFLAKHHPVN